MGCFLFVFQYVASLGVHPNFLSHRAALNVERIAKVEWDSEAFVKTFKRDYTRLVILPSGSGIIMRFSRTQG